MRRRVKHAGLYEEINREGVGGEDSYGYPIRPLRKVRVYVDRDDPTHYFYTTWQERSLIRSGGSWAVSLPYPVLCWDRLQSGNSMKWRGGDVLTIKVLKKGKREPWVLIRWFEHDNERGRAVVDGELLDESVMEPVPMFRKVGRRWVLDDSLVPKVQRRYNRINNPATKTWRRKLRDGQFSDTSPVVCIPKQIVDALGWKKGELLQLTFTANSTFVVRKYEEPPLTGDPWLDDMPIPEELGREVNNRRSHHKGKGGQKK